MNCDEEHIMCVCPVLMWFVSVSDLLYKACGFSRSMHMQASKPAHRQRCECVCVCDACGFGSCLRPVYRLCSINKIYSLESTGQAATVMLL